MTEQSLFPLVSDEDAARVADESIGPELPTSATAIAYADAIAPKRRRGAKKAAPILAEPAPVTAAPVHTPPPAPKSAYPKRLPDGSWGASVAEAAIVGDRLLITTSGGKSWGATVTRIVGQLEGRTIVETLGDDPPAARSSTRSRRGRGRGRSHHARIGGSDFFVNARGRCEDAPCCGCCS